MRRSLRQVVITAIATGMCSLQAHAIVVDDFSTDQGQQGDASMPLEVHPGANADSSWVNGAGLLGGQRDMFLFTDPGANNPQTSRARVAGGQLAMDNTPLYQSTLTVQYDGGDNAAVISPTGLGGVNLTADGSQAFRVDFGFSDVPGTIEIAVWSDANNRSTLLFASPFVINGLPGDDPFLLFPFAGFTQGPGAAGPADFTNIGAIQLTIQSPFEGQDIILTGITTVVPIPAAWLLFASAFGVLGFMRRRAT